MTKFQESENTLFASSGPYLVAVFGNSILVQNSMNGRFTLHDDYGYPYVRAALIAIAIDTGQTDGFK